jgi:hypothetical protein
MVNKKSFGTTADGKAVEIYLLTNAQGAERVLPHWPSARDDLRLRQVPGERQCGSHAVLCQRLGASLDRFAYDIVSVGPFEPHAPAHARDGIDEDGQTHAA